jgi:hypothetical protein
MLDRTSFVVSEILKIGRARVAERLGSQKHAWPALTDSIGWPPSICHQQGRSSRSVRTTATHKATPTISSVRVRGVEFLSSRRLTCTECVVRTAIDLGALTQCASRTPGSRASNFLTAPLSL